LEKCSFAIETPRLGRITIGTEKRKLSLFFQDETLHLWLLHRCDTLQAMREERIVIMEGDRALIQPLAQQFSFEPWRFFQVDYI
jgi:hypothetical protein